MSSKENKENKSQIIKLKNVRISHAHIFKAKDYEGDGNFKYSANALLDPSIPAHAATIKKLKKLMYGLAKQEWKGKVKLKPEKYFMRDGNEEETIRPEHEDMWVVVASNSKRPVVVDRDRTPLAAGDGKPESGDYVNMNISVWVQSNSWGKRINANLIGVQFAKEGEKFGSQLPSAEEQFEAMDFDDDDLDDFDSDDALDDDDDLDDFLL